MKPRAFSFFIVLAPILIVVLLLARTQSIKATSGIWLRPPFDGTYRVTSYFDHQNPSYVGDNFIWIYNGERVPSSLANHTGEPYPYDGHDGWDFSMDTGTDILAAAAGTVVIAEPGDWRLYGKTIVIDHGNNYYTQYSHLSSLLVGVGDPVSAGQHIAESGSSGTSAAHLHFTVGYGGYNLTTYTTDPFGWRGMQRDPLASYTGRESTCLWHNLDIDPVSCADTIVEDAGRGSTITGTWTVGNRGNGYHTYYRTNTTDNGVQASWVTTSVVPGVYKVYAFIPEQPLGVQTPKTQQAQYSIWSDTGWQTRVISQAYTNQWVLLGTFRIPSAYAQVVLSANTGETAGTRLVMADAIKFRSYLDFLPLIRKDPTPTPSPTPPATSTPIPPPTATPPPTAQCGQNALVNAGFESGLPGTPWQQYSSGGYQLISQQRPHSGSWGTWLAGYNNALDKIYQGFTVPSGAIQATLEFWWYMTSQETASTANDTLEIVMQSPPGNDVTGRFKISNLAARDGWYKQGILITQLGPWAGLPMWVDIEAKTNAAWLTHFFVDDISFVVQCGGASGQSSGDIPISPLATPTARP